MSPPLDANANANANVDPKVLQYENFIHEVLKKDLQKVLEQRDTVYEKISQYLQLKNTIQSLQAEVEDSSKIFVAVGFGFFLEMTHDEALRFIEKKTSQLTAFTEQLTKDSAKIKAHIRMVLECSLVAIFHVKSSPLVTIDERSLTMAMVSKVLDGVVV
ncbi:Protein UXT [Dissostichus eleginoides]|uniref:Protein UXT n=1 Tax=Dissostichus eleginoides TaxID=100907 RepID=A0AAD9CDU9_DISEL|nr:Protein UXT [Dissostichus eleginoides]